MLPIFPLFQIALTAGIGSFAAFLLLLLARSFSHIGSLSDMIGLAVVVGVSILVWRAAGNTAALNLDPIPAISPNDVLCSLVTYLFLGWYAAFRRPADTSRFEQMRVVLTLVSFLVNVVTI